MNELIVRNVSKKYDVDGNEVIALENISFTVKKRESISIVGPSGCGKTTLIRMICGLEEPNFGNIVFEGKPVKGPNADIMLIFQSFALLPWKTVSENVELALLDKPEKERKEIAEKFIDLVGLDGFESSYPKEVKRRNETACWYCACNLS